MNAIAVTPGTKEIALVEAPEPRIQRPDEVRIGVIDVGICGTDREIASFQYGTPPSGSEHLVIGHESVGEVLEIGSAVKGIKVGDLVVPMVRRPCAHRHCVACSEDRQDFCFTGDFTERGIKSAHGFMTEVVVDQEKYLNVVPRDLRAVAVLIEPLTIAEKALAEITTIQQRLPWGCPGSARDQGCHKAVVLGAGPVGLLGAMVLVHHGYQTFVYSRGKAPSRRTEIVAALGATYVSTGDTSLEQLAARVGNIDVVYEATGASSLSFEAMRHLGTNGVFALTGVPGRRGAVTIDTDALMRGLVLKNQVVFGTVNASKADFATAINDLRAFHQRWPEQVRSLITGRHSPGRFRQLLLGESTGIKEVISFTGL